MSLIARIRADQLEARKNKESLKATLLTTLLGEASKIGKDDGNRETTDAETVAVVKKFVKGVNDTLDFLKNTDNTTAKQICLAEKSVLEAYLPRQMTRQQIKGAILTLFERGETMNKGNMMKRLKEKFAGEYDGKEASAAVDEILDGK